MFDIEKELIALGDKKHVPDEALRQHTLEKLRGQVRRSLPRKSCALRWVAIPAAVSILAVVILLFLLPGVEPSSYFTIDINPSVSLQADADGVILSVKAQNDDASDLLADMDLTGMPFIEALRCVVKAADEQGYLQDNGHVLVAHFGASALVSDKDIETVVSSSTHKQVNVLLLQSDESDYHVADSKHQSAGILLLFKDAETLGINSADIDAVIDAVKKKGHSNIGNGTQNENEPSPAYTETVQPSESSGNNSGNGNSNHGSDGTESNSNNGSGENNSNQGNSDKAASSNNQNPNSNNGNGSNDNGNAHGDNNGNHNGDGNNEHDKPNKASSEGSEN